MESKAKKLRALMAAGSWQQALALAARFPDLGAHRDQIKRAHEAHSNGRFYEQLGMAPAELIAEGIRALKERYGDPAQLIRNGKSLAERTALLGQLLGSCSEQAELVAMLGKVAAYVADIGGDEAAELAISLRAFADSYADDDSAPC